MKKITKLFILLTLILLGTQSSFATPAGDNIIISEVAYDVTIETNEEWFELYNPTSSTIDISFWYVTDGEATFQFVNGITIASGAYFVVAHEGSAVNGVYGAGTADYEYIIAVPGIQLANTGDELTIEDIGHNVIDFVAWEGGGGGIHPTWTIAGDNEESIARVNSVDTDAVVDWASNQTPPTPGTGSLTIINQAPTDISIDGDNTDYVDENTLSGTNISVITTDDVDSGDTHTYSLVVGLGDEDNLNFTVSGSNLVLAFTPDYENPVDLGDTAGDNTYAIRLQADDGNGGLFQESLIVEIVDLPGNEIPYITSDGAGDTANISINENTTIVTTVTAIDPEADPIVYSKIAGDDRDLFAIDSVSGDIWFLVAPDFENPTDTDLDGIYEVQVVADDTLHGFVFDAQMLYITVDDVNDAPDEIFLDGISADSVDENTISGTEIAVLTNHDQDTADTHTYTLVAGPGDEDNGKFIIDGVNLQLAFTPDYENPIDLGDIAGNNTYAIKLQVEDGNGGIVQQAFNITILDVDEGSSSSRKKSSRKVPIEDLSIDEVEENDSSCGFVYSRLIRYGVSWGEDVKALQTLLNSLGFDTGVVDGWYGPNTFKGVKAFQTEMGIIRDGIVGPQSTAKLMGKCSA